MQWDGIAPLNGKCQQRFDCQLTFSTLNVIQENWTQCKLNESLGWCIESGESTTWADFKHFTVQPLEENPDDIHNWWGYKFTLEHH